jgi:phage nucleotide-binding protein
MPVKKAAKRKKALKILIYGSSGVGKTHFALHATPGKTLVFDMEGGTDLFEGRVDFDYWTDDQGYKTQSYKELRKCVDFLRSSGGKDYKTIVIDPITIIWTMLQQERQDYKENRVKKQKTNETDLETFTTRDWNIVKKMHKSVIDELSALPQNVILIAREKPVVEMKNGEPVSTGDFTYEGEKNAIYAVDFALRLVVDKKTKKRYIQVDKDRSGQYETGDKIDDPTFALFNDIINGMVGADENKGIKTDTEHLFDDSIPEPHPMNQEEKAKVEELAKQSNLTPEHLNNICKNNFNRPFAQITSQQARALISTLNKKVKELGTETKVIRDNTIKALHAAGSKKGMDHDVISQWAQQDYHVETMKDLTDDQGKELLEKMKEIPDMPSDLGQAG